MGMCIKRADIADALGLTSVLLIDKSTFLASNQMKMANLWINNQLLTLDKQALKPEDRMSNKQTLEEICEVIVACNRAPTSYFEEPSSIKKNKKVAYKL